MLFKQHNDSCIDFIACHLVPPVKVCRSGATRSGMYQVAECDVCCVVVV